MSLLGLLDLLELYEVTPSEAAVTRKRINDDGVRESPWRLRRGPWNGSVAWAVRGD